MLDQATMERNFKQIENARKKFLKLIEKIKDLSPVFTKFKNEYSEIVLANWGAKGKIMERERWMSYTPKYLELKQKKYPGKAMLEVTQKLIKAATNFDAKISKDKMVMEVKGEDYFYYVSDREKYGRKYFYTKEKNMPIQAWRILIELVKKQLDIEGENVQTI